MDKKMRIRQSNKSSRKRTCLVCGHTVVNMKSHYLRWHEEEWAENKMKQEQKHKEERRMRKPPIRNKEGLTLWEAQKRRNANKTGMLKFKHYFLMENI